MMKKEASKLTPSTWAILKHVWTLSAGNKAALASHTFVCMKAKNFLVKLDQTHPYRDYISFTGNIKKYEVSYIDTNSELIEKEQGYLMLSLRTVKATDSQVGIALVRIAPADFNMANYSEVS